MICSFMSCSSTKHVQNLFKASSEYSSKQYNENNLAGLPEPVQRYLRYALSDGQPYISYLRLKHDGLFKTKLENDFMPITGEQYFTLRKPGFVWVGKTKLFKARDSYINGEGNLSVYLFGFLRIVKYTGHSANQAELLRWLGESVWMPTNLIPHASLRWEPINNYHAKLILNHGGLEVYYEVAFNDEGQITSMLTERYTDAENKETWLGKVSNYQKVNGMMVPKTIEACWIIDGETKPYGRFNIKHMEYDVPEPW